MTRAEIVKDVCRQFPQFPTRSLARYLLDQHGGLWDNNIDTIRSAVRYYRGQQGEHNRNQAKEIIPSIKAEIPKDWNIKSKPFQLGQGKHLVLSDLHAPFHEIKAIESAVAYGQKEKVTGLLLNGDAQDCQSVSFWPSVRRPDFMGEVMVFTSILDFFQQELPKTKKIYKPGNHEWRLIRYYANRIPELVNSPMATFEAMIDFESRGIEFLDYHQKVMAGKLPIFHGHEFRSISTAVNPARGLFLKTKKWAAVAHYHRTSEHTDTDIDDNYLTCWSFGCLCNLHPEYMPFGGNWNWGFAIVEVDEKGNFEVHNKRILSSGKVV